MVTFEMRQTDSSLAISKEMDLVSRTSRFNLLIIESIPFHTNTVHTIQYHSDIKLFALLPVAINSNHVCCSTLLRCLHMSYLLTILPIILSHLSPAWIYVQYQNEVLRLIFLWSQWYISIYMRLKRKN